MAKWMDVDGERVYMDYDKYNKQMDRSIMLHLRNQISAAERYISVECDFLLSPSQRQPIPLDHSNLFTCLEIGHANDLRIDSRSALLIEPGPKMSFSIGHTRCSDGVHPAPRSFKQFFFIWSFPWKCESDLNEIALILINLFRLLRQNEFHRNEMRAIMPRNASYINKIVTFIPYTSIPFAFPTPPTHSLCTFVHTT